MKNRLFLFFATCFSVVLLSSCSDDKEETLEPIPATAKGEWTDPRDGNVYSWVRYGDTDWMATNFKYAHPDALIYQGYYDDSNNTYSEENLEKFGRLYNYPAAVESCPEGWRLPTDEDWKKLEQYMGMSEKEANAMDWRGNIAPRMISMYESHPDLNILLGGYFNRYTVGGMMSYRYMGIFGFYWTATRDENKEGEYYFYRKFTYAKEAVYRQSMEPSNQLLNVRYVRDAQ